MTSTTPPASLPARLLRRICLPAAALLFTACGGGGDAGTPAPVTPTVSNVSVDRLSYGRVSTFTVTGTNLATAVSFSATGCDGLVALSGGSATQQRLACTPNRALGVGFKANVGVNTLHDQTYPVPKPRVTMTTTLGEVVVELEPAIVQVTVDNFLAYVNSGFYDGTLFHRVIKDFIGQGGGFTAVSGTTLTPQTGLRPPIVLESNRGLSNLRGTIAMARTLVADSATSQFYFNAVDNHALLDYRNTLSPGYAVFGSIVSGLAVIDTMNGVATRTVGGFADVPVTDIVLQTAVQSL